MQGNNQNKKVQIPPSNPNFVQIEKQILQFWKDNEIFKKQLKQSENDEKFIFMEGPAFCQSTMHYGHMLAGSIKDSICRYFATNGYNVPRRLGYDTHGLPIEYEADKQLGIKSSNQIVSEEKLQQLKEQNVPGVEKMITIDKYNEYCEKLVLSTAQKWNTTLERIARGVDMENDYKTMYPTYMETSWWIFKQLWEKNLVYQGVKVMPFSWKLSCSLSNFEAGQNYRDVVDPCVVIKFKCVEQPIENVTRYFLAWTTTPWTLPSNLALCVNEEMTYCIVSQLDNPQEQYIVAEDRLPFVFLSGKNKDLKKVIKVIEKIQGKDLKGKEYHPLLPYFEQYKQDHPSAFTVLSDPYVTSDSGTGVVHQAPYFGEDDYRVCMSFGVISQKEQKIICPVDDTGCFTEEVQDFKGIQVKDADKQIIKMLKDQNKLFSQATINHSYPYCYRSDTPLIYKAVPSWFINVTAIKDKMLQNHMKTHWVPETFLTGRMKNWVENARDWAVSRNRFWGCPIPVWESQDGQVRKCIGSLQELIELAGEQQVENSGIFAQAGDKPHNIHNANIHRQFVDRVQIPDPRGDQYPPLRRVQPVFDCWFESGAMPYGQIHYPWCDMDSNDSIQNIHFKFQQQPNSAIGDFIAEGQDQVRGWFYTLLVESTALFDVPPSMNTIVNGLILASDGQKMSKRLKNYPDPNLVIDQYGADAVRLYLINSPAVRAMEMKFNVEGVKAVVKDVFIPLYNVYRLLMQSIVRQGDGYLEKVKLTADVNQLQQITHVFDIYIISSFIQLANQVHTEMRNYRLYTVLPKLLNFLSDLTNYYIRFNRDRMKQGEVANQVVFFLIINFCTLLAPFCPFISDYIYKSLAEISCDQMPESVHLQRMIAFTEEQEQKFTNQKIITMIDNLKQVIVLGRQCRLQQCQVSSFKTPLNAVKILCEKQQTLDELKTLEPYIIQELNILNVSYSTDINNYCQLKLYALIDKIKNTVTDKKLIGRTVKEAMDLSKKYTQEQVIKLQSGQSLEHNGIILDNQFFQITLEPTKPKSLAQGIFCVEFDTTSTNDVVQQLVQREIFSKINKLRKSAGLQMGDKKNVIISQVNNQEIVDVQKIINDIKNKVNGDIKLQDVNDEEEFDVEIEGLKVRVELEE